MRRSAAVVTVVALLALAGCAAPTPMAEKEYRTRISALPSYADLSDETIDELANGICDSVRDAAGEKQRTQIADYYSALAEDRDGTGYDAGRFARISVARFCPELSIAD